MNLLEETIEALEEEGLSPSDVVAVCSGKKCGSWDHFAAVAGFEYYDGFGLAEVNEDLKVIGEGWWMERVEYDGSEWWAFKKKPEVSGELEPLSVSDLRRDS